MGKEREYQELCSLVHLARENFNREFVAKRVQGCYPEFRNHSAKFRVVFDELKFRRSRRYIEPPEICVSREREKLLECEK